MLKKVSYKEINEKPKQINEIEQMLRDVPITCFMIEESNIFNMRTVNYIISAVIIFVVIAAIYKVFNEIFIIQLE